MTRSRAEQTSFIFKEGEIQGSTWESQEVGKSAAHEHTLRAEATAGDPKRKNWARAAVDTQESKEGKQLEERS